jgi:hypothetical protein
MIPPNVRVAGTKGVIEGQIASTFSRINGSSFRRTWRGLYGDLQLKQAWALTQAGWTDVVLEPANDGLLGVLSATFTGPPNGTTEIPLETLDLDFQEINGSIFKAPYFVPISGNRIKAIERCVSVARDPNKKTTDVTAKTDDEGVTVNGGPGGDPTELEAFNLKLLGVDEYQWENPILTYTRTVSPNFPTPLVIQDVGSIWTSAEVANYLAAKAVLFSIPAVSNNIGAPANFTLGWKKSAKFQFISNGNCQLIEKFVYGAWADRLYPD